MLFRRLFMNPAEINELLQQQNYNKYAVTDLGKYSYMVPKTESGKAAMDLLQKWNRRPPMGVQPGMYSPKWDIDNFTQAKKQVTMAKAAECSNFAFHAIGLLGKEKEITDQYNICLGGVMEGLHSIVILLPKGTQITEAQKMNGQLPKGALIIDPWAVGIGHDPKFALAVPPDQYCFRQYMKPLVTHYESDKDPKMNLNAAQTNVNTPSATIKPEVRQESQANTAPETRTSPQANTAPETRTSPQANTAIENKPDEFIKKLPSSSQNPELLKRFDSSLDQLQAVTIKLGESGFKQAFKEGKDLYNNLVKQRNEFSQKAQPTFQDKHNFSEKCNEVMDKAKEGELSKFQGFGKIFHNFAKAIVELFTGGKKTHSTHAVDKMNDIKSSLKDMKNEAQAQAQAPAPDIQAMPTYQRS